MKQLLNENSDNIIIDWNFTLQFDDKGQEPLWRSIEDKEAGNFQGFAKHKGFVSKIKILLPIDENKVAIHILSKSDILNLANKIREIEVKEEFLLCELEF